MYDTLMPFLEKIGLEVLNPWDLQPSINDMIKSVAQLDNYSEKVATLSRINHDTAKNNVSAMDEADCLIAVLDGTDVDSGTAAEIGYMYGKGKTCYGLRTDFRIISDNVGSKINLQVEYFCKGIALNLEQLQELLKL